MHGGRLGVDAIILACWFHPDLRAGAAASLDNGCLFNHRERIVFVIFGASGNVGYASATALRDAGHPVRAVVRDARHRERLARIGCEVVLADLTDAHAVAAALDGAHGVQMLCPVPVADDDPAATMRRMIDVAAAALAANPPRVLVALSDYGAELDFDTGITRLFHHLEARLKPLATRVTLLRSAEHLQNWARMMPVALATGVLPSLHHPVDKRFPAVSAPDVGAVAAALLLDDAPAGGPRVVSVEGPRRVSVRDVADALGAASGRTIVARELPREAWTGTLLRAGLSERHARLITNLYDVHNAGHIDVEAGATERRYGITEPAAVLAALVRRAMR
ncbi:NmrA family transcriptional regulator [Burkholderia sp. SRS-46]|nr:NmrA family transcriptional regulator [Burkholderia sp. SRS-46]